MSIESHVLRYAGIYEEPSNAYQVDHAATPGDFIALPYMEGSLEAQLAMENLSPMTGKMRLDGDDEQVHGPRSCTLACGITLHSHGVNMIATATAPTVTTWAFLRALKAIMGGVSSTGTEADGTVVVATATTATAVEVTTGHGDRWVAGSVIGCEVVSGSGLIEAREVLSVAGDVVSVKQAFSAAPVTGSAVRGGVTVFMTEDPQTSLQALIEGREGHDGLVLRGLQGGISLELPLGGLGQVQLSLAGAGWARVGTSAATIPSYSLFSPMALSPLEVTVPTIGATTRVALEQAEVQIQPQITYAPVRSGRATNTIARMRRQPVRPLVQGTFVVPYEDDTWYTAHTARQRRALFAQCGNVPGSTCLVSVPTIQIDQPQPAESGEGIAGVSVPWRGRHDVEIGSTGELSYSAFRLHFL